MKKKWVRVIRSSMCEWPPDRPSCTLKVCFQMLLGHGNEGETGMDKGGYTGCDTVIPHSRMGMWNCIVSPHIRYR